MICCTKLMFLMQKAMQRCQKVVEYQDMHATCAAQNSMIRNIYNSIARTRTRHLTIFRIAFVVHQWNYHYQVIIKLSLCIIEEPFVCVGEQAEEEEEAYATLPRPWLLRSRFLLDSSLVVQVLEFHCLLWQKPLMELSPLVMAHCDRKT